MPTCLAFGCSNNSGNKDGKSFFKIPDPKKDPLLCSRWLHNIGNSKWTLKNFVATKDRVVCSDHVVNFHYKTCCFVFFTKTKKLMTLHT